MTTNQFRDVFLLKIALITDPFDNEPSTNYLACERLADAIEIKRQYLLSDDTPVAHILYDNNMGTAFRDYDDNLYVVSIKQITYITPCPSSTSVAEIASSLG